MSKEKDYLKMVENTSTAWSSLPPLVRQIKDDAQAVLLNLLEDLFSNCDDLFFDLSSRASSNAEQNLIFRIDARIALQESRCHQLPTGRISNKTFSHSRKPSTFGAQPTGFGQCRYFKPGAERYARAGSRHQRHDFQSAHQLSGSALSPGHATRLSDPPRHDRSGQQSARPRANLPSVCESLRIVRHQYQSSKSLSSSSSIVSLSAS